MHCKEGIKRQDYRCILWLKSLYRSLPVLSADTYGSILWNVLNLLIVAFYLFEIGMLLGFGSVFWVFENNYLFAFNTLFLLVMLLDILTSPLRSYYEAGVIIIDRELLFQRSKSHLPLDLLSLIGVAVPYVTGSLYANTLKLLFLARLYRAYQIDHEVKVAVQLRTESYLWFTVVRLLLLALILSHYLGIAFYWVDYIVYVSNYYGPNTPAYCWLYNSQTQYALVVEEEWYVLYLYTIYFSVGNITTIAYGDIVPLNAWETLVTNALMIASILVFTYFFKSVIEAFFFSSLTA